MYRGGVVLRLAPVPWDERVQPDHSHSRDARVRIARYFRSLHLVFLPQDPFQL